MQEIDLLNQIEGRDEDGNAKAIATVSLISPEPTCLAQASSQTGAVFFSIIPGGLSIIDVVFEESTDFDYLKISGICENSNKEISNANKEGKEVPSLCITLLPVNSLDAYLTATDCVWSYIALRADKVCSGIRFITKTENLHFIELDENELDLLLDEVEESIIEDEIKQMEE